MSKKEWAREIIKTIAVALFCLAVVALVAGCVTPDPMPKLISDAQSCVARAQVENSTKRSDGLVTLATAEQREQCWHLVNAKLEAQARGDERRAKEKSHCPMGYVEWCESRSSSDKRCTCARMEEVRRVLRGY